MREYILSCPHVSSEHPSVQAAVKGLDSERKRLERDMKLKRKFQKDKEEDGKKDEFKEDLTRFKYLKRLLRRYEQYGDLQERLILNHIIVLYNVFGIEAANRMMWFKVEPEHYSILKTFLIFLNYLPEDSHVEIPLDQEIINKLRNL